MRIYTCKVSPNNPVNPQVPTLAGTLTEHPETDNGQLDEIIRYVRYTSNLANDTSVSTNHPACILTKEIGSDKLHIFRFRTLSSAMMGAIGMGSQALAVLFFEKIPGDPSRIFTHTLTVIKFDNGEIEWNSSGQ